MTGAVVRIAPQGWRLMLPGFLLMGAGCFPHSAGLRAALFLGGSIWAVFCAFFFRDPDRECPGRPGKLYASGDGRVLSVAREGPGDITTIRIFLSLFDVHVQRCPCSGRVDRVGYQPGTFSPAMRPDAKFNERSWVRIVPAEGPPVVVEQIAGRLARRIECRVREGDTVRSGDRYGMIYFGSQVAIHLPGQARPLVRPGDRVAGGLTEIGEWIKPG